MLARGTATRLRDVISARSYDIVFVQREALMAGPPLIERALARTRARVVFDFDDAIWLPNVSAGNRRFAWLKNPDKTPTIIELADLVFAGNEYLADYARQYNTEVRVVPSTIDTDVHRPAADQRSAVGGQPVSIGWCGSTTTVPHFEHAVPALGRVRDALGDKVTFRLTGDPEYRNAELGIVGKAWALESELSDVQSFDIGIMPLPDDRWTRGKCGLKGLLYMAAGVPAVLSPVGVNREIIGNDEYGRLAGSEDQWVNALVELATDETLRMHLGAKGRERVVDRYSVRAWRDTYATEFESLL